MPALFKGGRPYVILFADAPGGAEGAPVRRSGVRVGEKVRSIRLDSDSDQVEVSIYVDPTFVVRHNDVPTLYTGILGTDTTIESQCRVLATRARQPPLDHPVRPCPQGNNWYERKRPPPLAAC